MSQTISPVDWLQSALGFFMVSDIVENMSTDERGLLWTCELSFDISTRGPSGHPQHIQQTSRWSLSRIIAQFDAVAFCLQALQCICYHMPDYSCFKMEALRAGNVPVAQVSEMFARHNQMDVVKSSHWDPSRVIYYYYYWNNVLWFFLFSACRFYSMSIPMLHVACR